MISNCDFLEQILSLFLTPSIILSYFISGDHSECLRDKPQKAVTLPERLPGELYNADDQCSRAFGDKSTVCPAPFLKEVSFNTLNELNSNNIDRKHHHHDLV